MGGSGLHAEHLWTPQGWRRDVRLRVEHGCIAAMEPGGSASAESAGRFVLPGMPNLHSHAFQRAMAGLAERRGGPAEKSRQERPLFDLRDQGRSQENDNFWSWRETMYSFASRIGPDDLHAIASQLYVEMLEAGYTHVCEFHYLHNAPDGKPYADPASMSLALVEAAREAGIGLTLLPVLYQTRGFDGGPLSERQGRFGMEVEAYLRLLERLRALESPMLRVGIALHSLRAVPEAALREVLASGSASSYPHPPFGHPLPEGEGKSLPPQGEPEPSPQPRSRRERGSIPIHIHIAEQIGEVEECLAVRGARPVRWLFDHADVDARWCLVHATHLDEGEIDSLARSGAVAGLCPTTEANLGDGLFPLAGYLRAKGALGIGSDSHISVSPVEELRWLEYGQRLATRSRNVAALEPGESVGETLWKAALHGGAQASGVEKNGLAARADLLVLDEDSPLLAARDQDNVLDAFIFAGNRPLVRDVMVNGEWVVRGFHHRDGERIAARYRHCVESLG